MKDRRRVYTLKKCPKAGKVVVRTLSMMQREDWRPAFVYVQGSESGKL